MVVLEYGPGTHNLDPIVGATEPVTVLCKGIDATELRFTAPGPMLRVDYSAFYQGGVTFKDCTITREGADPGPAAVITYPRADSIWQSCVTFENVVFRNDPLSGEVGWASGIDLVNAWGVTLENVRLSGSIGHPHIPGSYAVRARGRGANIAQINCNTIGYETGYMAGDEVQGWLLDHCSALDVEYGAWVNIDPANGQPGFEVRNNCHFNTRQRGVVLRGAQQFAIDGMLAYKDQGSTADWWAIDVQAGSDDGRIAGVEMVNNASASSHSGGMAIAAHNVNVGSGVVGRNLDLIAWFSKDSANCSMAGGWTNVGCRGTVINNGTHNSFPG